MGVSIETTDFGQRIIGHLYIFHGFSS